VTPRYGYRMSNLALLWQDDSAWTALMQSFTYLGLSGILRIHFSDSEISRLFVNQEGKPVFRTLLVKDSDDTALALHKRWRALEQMLRAFFLGGCHRSELLKQLKEKGEEWHVRRAFGKRNRFRDEFRKPCTQFEIIDAFSRQTRNRNRLSKAWKSGNELWEEKFPKSHERCQERK